MEVFKPVVGYEDYYMVSDCGNVKSIRRGVLLKSECDRCGYKVYTISVNGVRKTLKAHRLVAEAFIPNPEGKPTVDHINNIRQDNRVENLRWATNKEQKRNPITLEKIRDNNTPERMREMGEVRDFGRKNVVVKYPNGDEETYPSLLKAAEGIGYNYSHLSEVLNGKRKTERFCIAVTRKHFPEDNEDES